MIWLSARFSGRCARCPEPIMRGDRIARVGRLVCCRACGRAAEAAQAVREDAARDAAANARRMQDA